MAEELDVNSYADSLSIGGVLSNSTIKSGSGNDSIRVGGAVNGAVLRSGAANDSI